VPALTFASLPKALKSGRRDHFGFVDNDASSSEVPGRIGVQIFDRHGHLLNSRELGPSARGSDLVSLRMTLGDRYLTVEGSYTEDRQNGSSCLREMSQRVHERRRIYFPSRCYNETIRPSDVVVACGDGNFQLKSMRWRHWHANTARGDGTGVYNDCDPYCAAGHFHSEGVRVWLSKPKYCEAKHRYMYTRLQYHLAEPPEGGGRQNGTYPFPCRLYD
jgi:hypothetical protein